jgi:hypothetical protein
MRLEEKFRVVAVGGVNEASHHRFVAGCLGCRHWLLSLDFCERSRVACSVGGCLMHPQQGFLDDVVASETLTSMR